MPAAAAELRPLTRGLPLTLAIWLLAAGSAKAQDADSAGLVSAGPELAITRLADAWVAQAGGSVSVRVTPWLRLGGAGRVSLHHPEVRDEGGAARVRFGYGGLTVALLPAPARDPGLSLSLLAAAGNVDVEDPGLGTVIDADNGLVLEPAVGWSRRLGARLDATGALSWRLAIGFDALGGVDSDTLRGPALALGLRFGPF